MRTCSCPRLCIIAALAVVGGLLPLVFTHIVVSRLPRSSVPLFTPPAFLEHVSEWRPTKQEGITPNPPISLFFVGDIMLDREVAARSQKAQDPGYPFRRLPVDWFKSADLTVANLEGPVTDTRRPPEKTIDFQFATTTPKLLIEQGIDVVSQANNHALDQGRLGYEESVRRLREAGLIVFGDQVRDDEVSLATTTIRGLRFAFVGFNTTDNPLDETAASSSLARARTQADQVIVYMHWGPEYRDRPHVNEEGLAKWLIDHGADVVIGTHPHWVQGISIYKGRPIVYSLGNFIFDQDFSQETKEGLAVKLLFEQGRLVLELTPVHIDRSQPFILEGEMRTRRLERLANISEESLREQIRAGALIFNK